MERITSLLPGRTAQDIKETKASSLEVSVQKRMATLGIESLDEYVVYIEENEIEDIPLYIAIFMEVNAHITDYSVIQRAICKKYIELLGGTIDLKSTPGKGSTFTVRIPEYGS